MREVGAVSGAQDVLRRSQLARLPRLPHCWASEGPKCGTMPTEPAGKFLPTPQLVQGGQGLPPWQPGPCQDEVCTCESAAAASPPLTGRQPNLPTWGPRGGGCTIRHLPALIFLDSRILAKENKPEPKILPPTPLIKFADTTA